MKPSLAFLLPLACRTLLAVLTLSVAGLTCRHAAAAPPPNDNLANARVIPTGSSFAVNGTEVDASTETFEKTANYPYNDLTKTVWYSWTPSVSGVLTVSASGGLFAKGTIVFRTTSLRHNVLFTNVFAQGEWVTQVHLGPLPSIHGTSQDADVDQYASLRPLVVLENDYRTEVAAMSEEKVRKRI